MIQNIIVSIAIAGFLMVSVILFIFHEQRKAFMSLCVAYLILAAGQAWHVRNYHHSLDVIRAQVKAYSECR